MILVDGEAELKRELQKALYQGIVTGITVGEMAEALIPLFRRELAKAVAAAPVPGFQKALADQVAKELSPVPAIRQLCEERYTGGEYEAGLDDMAGLVLDLIKGKRLRL
jgi:hypothetical protein